MIASAVPSWRAEVRRRRARFDPSSAGAPAAPRGRERGAPPPTGEQRRGRRERRAQSAPERPWRASSLARHRVLPARSADLLLARLRAFGAFFARAVLLAGALFTRGALVLFFSFGTPSALLRASGPRQQFRFRRRGRFGFGEHVHLGDRCPSPAAGARRGAGSRLGGEPGLHSSRIRTAAWPASGGGRQGEAARTRARRRRRSSRRGPAARAFRR